MIEPARKFDDEELNPARRHLRAVEGGGEGEGAPESRLTSVDSGKEYYSGRTSSPDELAKNESSGGTPTATTEAKEEASSLGADNGGWYNDEGGQAEPRKFWTKRKNIIAGGGIAGLGISGVFVIFSILQGPTAIVHASKLLSGLPFAPNINATDSRLGRLFEYGRPAAVKDPTLRNIGYFGEKLTNKFMADLSRQGIELEFDRPYSDRQSRRLQAIRVTSPAAAKAMTDLGYTINTDGTVDLGENRGSARDRRLALYAAVNELNNKGRVVSAVSKRMLAVRAGVDFHPFRNIARDQRESLADYYNKRRAERSEAIKNGVVVRAGTGDIQGATETDPNDPASQREVPGNRQVADAGNEVVREAANANTPNIRKGLVARFGGGALAVVGAACAAKAIGDAIPTYQHTNIVLPMLRMSMKLVAMGSQIQTGQSVNLDEVGEVYDTLHDEETGSFFSAKGMQAISGQQNLTGPDTKVKPSAVGDKPEVFTLLDSAPGLSGVCTVQEGVMRLPVIKQVVGVVDNVTGVAVDGILSAFGTTEEELMDRLIAVLAGDVVDTLATGSELGNIAAIGSRLAANETAIASGGTEISPAEFRVLQNEFLETNRKYMASLPWFERMLNVYRPNSLAGSLFARLPALDSSTNIIASVRMAPTNFFKELVSLSPFGSIVMAQASTEFDFGVPAFGHSESLLNNENLTDPYAVANWVEPRLETLNDRYGKCFGATIDPVTFKIIEGVSPKYQDLTKSEEYAHCRNPSSDRNYYSIYLLDQRTFKAAACFEGIDELACAELRLASAPNPARAAVVSGGDFRGEDTSARQCVVGSDAGIHPTPDPNIKIRLCSVNGIVVNVAIESNVKAIVDGGQAAGLGFSGTGYRSHQRQIELRKQNCGGTSHYIVFEKPAGQCSPATAIPGRSLHEWGLAVDFRCNGSSIGSRSSPCFQWLSENQSVHQLKHLSSGPWHWSTTGG